MTRTGTCWAEIRRTFSSSLLTRKKQRSMSRPPRNAMDEVFGNELIICVSILLKMAMVARLQMGFEYIWCYDVESYFLCLHRTHPWVEIRYDQFLREDMKRM